MAMPDYRGINFNPGYSGSGPGGITRQGGSMNPGVGNLGFYPMQYGNIPQFQFGSTAPFDTQKIIAQIQAQTARDQMAAETQRAQIAADAARYPEEMKQQRFSQLLGGLFGPGFGGSPGGGQVRTLPVGGGEQQQWLGMPGGGLAAPPQVPGSVLAPPPMPGGFGGGFGGMFGGFGGGGGNFELGPIDKTLPSYGPSPFSRDAQRGEENRFRASNTQQQQTAEKQARQQYAQQGGGLNRQGQARMAQIGQQSRANMWRGLGDIRQQFGQARAGLELQQQGQTAEARARLNQLYPEYAKARAAAQQPAISLFSSLLGAI